jgi:hypothetical protein
VIVLTSGDAVYFVPHISRYAGFIDDLKEGAQVKIDGYNMGTGYLVPSKITISGKNYDVSRNYGYGNYGGTGYGCRGGGRWHW